MQGEGGNAVGRRGGRGRAPIAARWRGRGCCWSLEAVLGSLVFVVRGCGRRRRRLACRSLVATCKSQTVLQALQLCRGEAGKEHRARLDWHCDVHETTETCRGLSLSSGSVHRSISPTGYSAPTIA